MSPNSRDLDSSISSLNSDIREVSSLPQTLTSLSEKVAMPVIGVHTFNPYAQEAEEGGSLDLRLAPSTLQILEQIGLHRKTLPQKNKSKRIKINKRKYGHVGWLFSLYGLRKF